MKRKYRAILHKGSPRLVLYDEYESLEEAIARVYPEELLGLINRAIVRESGEHARKLMVDKCEFCDRPQVGWYGWHSLCAGHAKGVLSDWKYSMFGR